MNESATPPAVVVEEVEWDPHKTYDNALMWQFRHENDTGSDQNDFVPNASWEKHFKRLEKAGVTDPRLGLINPVRFEQKLYKQSEEMQQEQQSSNKLSKSEP